MKTLTLPLISLLAAAVSPAALATPNPPRCRNIQVPVTITATNFVFNLTAPASQIALTDLVLDFAQQGRVLPAELITGFSNVSGTYTLATTFCEPSAGGKKSSVVQLLTHGIGFDRRYWDVPDPASSPQAKSKYSYVHAALAEGYATLSYDRLGIGASQHGEPISEIQAPLEIAALTALARALRSGTGIPGLEGRRFRKVVGVGHSFGSVQTYTAAQLDTSLFDGIVLTGFSQNATFISAFSYGQSFVDASSLRGSTYKEKGYITAGSAIGVHQIFFAPRNFDPEVLAYAAGPAAQPLALGELFTVLGGTTEKNHFPGPVMLIIGGRDVPFCGGDCINTGNPAVPSLLEASRPFFDKASELELVVVPNTGHGMNFEFTAPTTYKTILDFTKAHVA